MSPCLPPPVLRGGRQAENSNEGRFRCQIRGDAAEREMRRVDRREGTSSTAAITAPAEGYPATSFTCLRKASISCRVIGPGLPSPMTRRSMLVTGTTSAADPVRKHSSATYKS